MPCLHSLVPSTLRRDIKEHAGDPYMKLLYAIALFVAATAANAEVTLPKVFSSHMVLQRDMPIHIWGDAAPGEQITVDLHGANNTATTDNLGRWSLYLPAQAAGGPFTLTIHGTNTVQLDDILIGDLWIASGQSNMEMPLAGFPGSAVVKDADKGDRRRQLSTDPAPPC